MINELQDPEMLSKITLKNGYKFIIPTFFQITRFIKNIAY